MASRENQGLQVALILFVMITVALSVFSYVTWDNMSESEKQRDDAVEKATAADNSRRSSEMMVKFLKSLMGYGTITPAELSQMAETIKANSQLGADYNTIKANFDADMLQFEEAAHRRCDDRRRRSFSDWGSPGLAWSDARCNR